MNSVDVVVPCYNYANYLESCIRSILDQPDVQVRALVIDDCSTDESETVGRRLALADRRVEYRRHQKNHGHIATYNEGLLGWASAEYCLLISADDLLRPGALSRAVRVLEQHTSVGMCCGRQIVFSDEPETKAAESAGETRIQSGRDFWIETCRSGQNVVATPTAVVRTRVQHAVGGYRPELPHSGDLEMWLRIAAVSDVATLPDFQACKRIHGNNMQVAYLKHLLGDLIERHKAIESAADTCRDALGNAAEYLSTARRTLATEAIWAASSQLDHGRRAESAECLRTARAIDPRVTRTMPWARARAKQLWSLVARPSPA